MLMADSTVQPMTRIMKASEFEANCLAIMDEVALTGEPVQITKNGKPIADVVPHRPASRQAFGIWKDLGTIEGDIISPLDAEWEALK